MDQPGLDPNEHALALTGLARLNAASRAAPAVWGAIRRIVGPPRDKPLRVLDVAAGGGDLAREVGKLASRGGYVIDVLGIDMSPTAVTRARGLTPIGAPIAFATADALRDELPQGYDIVTSTLFLHHLEEADVIRLLRRMAAAATIGVVISDLRRSIAGYVLAQVACRTLSRSPIVHYDGPLSVESAFTSEEFRRLALQAGLETMQVRRQWPQRLLATWRREEA